jgi:hypothetical protein
VSSTWNYTSIAKIPKKYLPGGSNEVMGGLHAHPRGLAAGLMDGGARPGR